MEAAHVKNHAPHARGAFIAAVAARTVACGLTADAAVEPMTERGGVVLLVGLQVVLEELVAEVAAHRKKPESERVTLVRQRSELQEFDEKLRHYADQRITLDLDAGVKAEG